MVNLTHRWTNQDLFSKISSFFFSIFKKGQESPPLPPPSCAPVSVAEYASVSLNIPEYPWKCLSKLFWLCQVSECTWSSYMFDPLLKMLRVLHVPGFWIWHGCICKGYTYFWIYVIWLNTLQQCLTMPQYALMSMNMPEHSWILLNVLDYASMSCFDYAKVLNMPHHLRCLTGFWIFLRHSE